VILYHRHRVAEADMDGVDLEIGDDEIISASKDDPQEDR
jgi:hypothetical protein